MLEPPLDEAKPCRPDRATRSRPSFSSVKGTIVVDHSIEDSRGPPVSSLAGPHGTCKMQVQTAYRLVSDAHYGARRLLIAHLQVATAM